MTAKQLRELVARNGMMISEYPMAGFYRAVLFGPRNSGIRLSEADGKTPTLAMRSLCRRVSAIREAK